MIELEKLIRTNIPNYDMYVANGVEIENPLHTYIEKDVVIESEVKILAGSRISGKSIIKNKAVIGPDARIESSTIGSETVVFDSTILESTVAEHTKVGPYAYIRPNSKVGSNVKVGDFVEVKNAVIGDNTKISHLSYVGDADVGNGVNIGCGVVFTNYDGNFKYRSTVEDNSFIGCNVNIVSPVNIGKGAYIAAGSTITKDVVADALAIAREKQRAIEGWAVKHREKKKLK